MNSQIAEAFVRIRPDMRGFKSETEAGFNSAFRDAARSAAKIAGGVLAARGAVDVIKELTQAAAAHEAAFDVLDRTLQNAGLSAKGFSASLKDVLEQQARLKGFSAEELASSMVRLVSVTKNVQTALKDLGLAEDLARARHIDLATAALALSKAEQGSLTALQRYGIIVPKVGAAVAALKKQHDDAVAAGAKFTGVLKLQYDQALATATATDKAARRAEVFNLIHQRFGGAASTFANSAAGQFARLGEDIHQLEISIGTGLLPTMTGAAEGLRRLSEAAAKSDIGPTLGRALHDVGQALSFIAPLAQTAGQALLTFSKAAESVVSAVGAPALVTALAVYKGIPLVIGLAEAAQKRFIVLAGGSAVASKADAGAKLNESEAAAAATKAISELTVALDANTTATAENVGATRLSLSGFSTFASTAEKAAPAVEETAAATVGFRTALAGLGAGLAAALTSTTAITLGVAALAGGLIYLATRESAAEKATKSYRDTLAELDRGLQNSIQLRQHLADLTKSTIPSDKTSISQAQLTVEQDRYALSTTNAAKGSAEYRQLVINLRRDIIALSDAQRTLSKDQADVTKTGLGLNNQAVATSAGYAKAEKQIEDARTRAREGFYKSILNPPSAGGFPVATDKRQLRQDMLRDFFKSIEATATTPGLQKGVTALESFVNSVGRLPSNREIKIAFRSAPGSLDEFLNKINQKGQAKGAGEAAGASYSAGFASGVTSGSGLVESAIARMVARASSGVQIPRGSTPTPPLRRATGGYVPGSGDSDTVPALLTPQEIVLNKQQQRLLRVQLGMKQFGSAQELFNRINGGNGTGLPLFGPPVLSGAYNEIGSSKGSPVQKFAGGGVVLENWIRNARRHYSDAQIRGQIHRWHPDWSEASILNTIDAAEQPRMSANAGALAKYSPGGGISSSIDHASMRTDDLQAIGRASRSPLVQQIGMATNPVSAAIATAQQIGALGSSGYNLARNPSLGNLGSFGVNAGFAALSLLPIEGGAIRDAALYYRQAAANRALGARYSLAPLFSRVHGGQMSLGEIAGGQSSLFDRIKRNRIPRAQHLTSLHSIVEPIAQPIPGESIYSTGIYHPSFWTGEDINAFPAAMHSNIDLIDQIHGWPDYARQRKLPLHLETSDEGYGHMRPKKLGFPHGIGFSHIAVRPDPELARFGFGLLRDRTIGSFAHELAHSLDYGPLKLRANSKLPGSVAAAMGHIADPHWTNLWNALEQHPSIQRMVAARADLRTEVANSGGWATSEMRARLDNYDYLLNPAEMFARGYQQWIGERTRDKGILGSLTAEFAASNAFPSAGRGEWVYADLPRSEDHTVEILNSVLVGGNHSFSPIANAFEQLFASRGLLHGDPIMRDVPAGMASVGGASIGSFRRVMEGSHLADVMSTRFAKTGSARKMTAFEKAFEKDAARRADALAVGGEYVSHNGILAPRVRNKAERDAIGFPDLPRVPKSMNRLIQKEVDRISKMTFPLTDAQKPKIVSAADMGLPDKVLAHRFEQAIQAYLVMGDRAPFWYEDQGPYMRGLAERERITPVQAVRVIAVNSAQAAPSPTNMFKGVVGIRQMQQLGEITDQLNGDQRKAVADIMHGLPWKATTTNLKTSNFAPNLFTGAYGVDAALEAGLDPFGVTNDVHVSRALWPARDMPGKLIEGYSAPKIGPLGNYLVATEFNKGLSNILGFDLPMHGQAAPWGTINAISELTKPVGRTVSTWEEALANPKANYAMGFDLTSGPLTRADKSVIPGTQPMSDLASRSRPEGWMGGTPWGGPGSPISGTWLHGGHINEIPGVGPGRPLFTTNDMEAAQFYAGEKHRPGEGAIHRLGLNLPKTADMNLLERVVNHLGVGPHDLYDAGMIHMADVDRVKSRRMSFDDQMGWLGVNPTDYLYIQKVVEALKGKGFAGYSDYDGFLNTGGIPVALPFRNSSIKNLGAVPFSYPRFALGGVVGAAAVPMRRNIGGWLQRFKGRGLSPALALDAARWWGAHWPAQKMFASGGIAPGQGSGDTVPAMLTPGELILNRGEQSRLGGMLGMPGASAHALFGAISGRSSAGGGMFAGGGVSDDWLAQAAPASAQGIFSQVLKAELAPTIKVKPKLAVDSTTAGELRQALTGVLEQVYNYSAADASSVLAGKTKTELVQIYEALVGPLSKAAKKGIADPIEAALEASIKSTKQGLDAYAASEAQTISGLKQNVGDLQTSLSDQIKQTAIDVQGAIDSAKQNVTGLASSVSSFIDSYIDKPLQNEQQRLSAQQNKLALTRLGQSVLLPGGHTLSSDPTKGLAQLRTLARKNPATRLAVNDFITQQYEPAVLAVKQDRATSLKQALDRRGNDLQYLANTGKITPAQYQAGVNAILRRAGFTPARAKALLGVGAAGVFGEQENALFAQARINAAGPQRPGSGAVGPLVRPLDVLHRDQREIHRITRQIGDAQIALQKEIAASTKKTAAATAKLQALQEQQARHQGASKDRNTGKSNKTATDLSGTGK